MGKSGAIYIANEQVENVENIISAVAASLATHCPVPMVSRKFEHYCRWFVGSWSCGKLVNYQMMRVKREEFINGKKFLPIY